MEGKYFGFNTLSKTNFFFYIGNSKTAISLSVLEILLYPTVSGKPSSYSLQSFQEYHCPTPQKIL